MVRQITVEAVMENASFTEKIASRNVKSPPSARSEDLARSPPYPNLT